MSEQIYTIKESTLQQLFDDVRLSRGLSTDEGEKQTLTFEQLKVELKEIAEDRGNYVDFLNQKTGTTLYLPQEISIIPINFLKPYSWVNYIKWGKHESITINSNAFSNSSLISIILPKEIIQMGASVFNDCSKLKQVHWNCKNLTAVPMRTFDSVSTLEEVFFSEEAAKNIVTIGEEAFNLSASYAMNLKMNFNSLKNLTSIKTSAFDGSGLTLIDDNKEVISKLNIPIGIASLGSRAFAKTRFTEVYFPNTFKEFNSYEFSDSQVEKIYFDENREEIAIGEASFLQSKVQEIINSECIVEIKNSGFYFAPLNATENITFNNVKKISFQSFGFTNVKELSLPKLEYCEHVTGGRAEPFYNSKIEILEFGTSFGQEERHEENFYNEITSSFFKKSKINTIKFRGTLEDWCSRVITSVDSDWPFLKEKTNEAGEVTYNQLYVLNSAGELVEPKGTLGSSITSDNPYILNIETINSNVFYGYKNFGSFQFSNNLKNIKADAFKNSQLNTSNDRIRFDMYPYEYLQINFENEYSTIFASTTQGTAAEMSKINFKNPNGTNYSNINSIGDSTSLFIPSDSGKQYMNPLIFNKNVFANVPFANLYLGSAAAYPNKDLVVEFKDKVFYQSPEKLKNAEGEVVKRGINTCNFYQTKNIIIGNQSFYNNNRVVSLQTQGTSAAGYQDCNISSIGEEAFYGCTSLKSTQVVSSNTFILPIIKTIGDKAFYGCSALTTVVLGSETSSVESIGSEAFYGTGVTDLTIYFDTTLYNDPSEMDNYPWGLDEASIHGPLED